MLEGQEGSRDKVPGSAGEKPMGGGAGSTVAGGMDADRHRVRRGIVCTLVGGTLWGLNGTASKFLMDAYGIDPLWLVCVRELTACWLFLAVAAATPRGRGQLAGVLHDRRGMVQILGVSLGAILFSQVAYMEAVDWTNSATATIMQSLGILLVLAWTCLRGRRVPRGREALGVALALVGTYLVITGGKPGQLSLPAGGVAWGLACAASSACLSVLPAKPMERWGNFVVNGLAFLVSGVILSLAYRPWEHMPTLDAVGVVVVVACVVLGTFGAYALYLQGVHDAGSMRAAMLGTSEPVAATIASAAWLGTSFSPAELLGFALVLCMVYLTA